MKSRVSLLAQRITAIREEFSESEIQSALKRLEKQDSASQVRAPLGSVKKTSRLRPTSHRRKKKTTQDQRSKAVIRLEHQDPEKYRVLFELDSLLRNGSVLPRVNDITRLGESLTKDFTSRGSRRDSISKLMTVLASRSFDEISTVVNAVLSNRELQNDESDYQRLARFIITGKASHSARDLRSRAS
jgi:hypothetical protein